MSQDMFLKLLFDEGQKTCFSEDAKGTTVKMYPGKQDVFFSINALHPTEDMAPCMPYHREDKPRRADANVVCFRNFLIELDDMPLNEQIDYVKARIPYTTTTYSGGKSFHFVISLDEPCEDYNEYMDMVERIHELLPKIDAACKNPSRLSRLPNVIRQDTGKRQSLHYLGERISKARLRDLLPSSKKAFKPITPSYNGGNSKFFPVDLVDAIGNPTEKAQHLGGRNVFFYWLGNRMRENMYDDSFIAEKVDQAYARLADTAGFSIEEAYSAARIR